MDKANKIRRYLRKDYTQVVQFPVEIIGRDGIVRRYSFEESIRLYQRRVASADIRYQDRELIQAEKQHCLQRIDQLRRSFFSHYGWPALQLVDTAATGPQALSAEVAAFLRRCLAYLDRDPALFTFSHLETTEDRQVYFIQPPADGDQRDQIDSGHFLLYVFAFEKTGSCPKREAFFKLIKIMDSVYLGQVGAIESLVAFFHTHDCGLVLTGTGNVRQRAPKAHEVQELEISWPIDAVQYDPVEHAMRMLSRGQFKQALERFIDGYTEHHYRRVAYLGAAVVADVLGEDTEAETATVMGCRYFPGDPALVYHHAVNLARRGDFTEALRRIQEIDEWPRGKPAIDLLAAICLLLRFQHREGKKCLRRVPSGAFRLDPHLSRAHEWIQRQLWTRDIIVALCALASFTAFAVGISKAEWAWGLVGVAGLVFIRMAILAWAYQLKSAICGASEQRCRLSSSAILIESQSNEFLQ
jgi:hypothetical protein